MYIAGSVITAFIAYCSCNSGRKLSAVLKIVSVAPLVLLAALRADEVGTDVLVYVMPVFYSSPHEGLVDMLTGSSPLFHMLAWIGNVVLHSRFAYLMLIQLVINGSVYWVLYRSSRDTAWVGITIFNLVFYCYTLNLVRQSCAVALVLLAARYVYENNYRKYLFFQFLALGFHETAVLGAFYPVMQFVLSNMNEREIKTFKINPKGMILSFAFLLCTTILVCFDWLVTLKSSWSYQAAHEGSTDYKMFVAWIAFAVVCLLLKRDKSIQCDEMGAGADYFELATLVGCIVFMLAFKSVELFRLSLYYFASFPVYISIITSELVSVKSKKYIGFLLTLGVIFWFWKFGWQGVGAVVPYAFV